MNDISSSTDSATSGDSLQAATARRRRTRVRVALIVVAILVVIFLIVHHSKQSQLAKEMGPGGPNPPVAVATAAAIEGDVPVTIPALGTVTPLATVTVRTQISGQLTQVAFKEGQMVREGDFLAQIDPRPYQATLEQSQGNLRRDQALLANAQVDLTRYRGLVAEDSIARQQLDTQVSLVEQYQGTVVSDQAAVASARLNLQYAHIVSPVSGRVGLRQVDAGNYVTPADTNGLVVVTQLQPITVIFPVPEDNASMISKRLHDGMTLTVAAYDRTNTTKLADGKLLTLDNQIDSTTGTIKLRAQFDNKDGLLFANQFVNVQLLLDIQRHQVIIPNAAVHHGAPNGASSTFVYLVKADNTVSVRPVNLGTANGEQIAVLSGLKPGDTVVTEGGDRLREGARIVPPPAAASQKPG